MGRVKSGGLQVKFTVFIEVGRFTFTLIDGREISGQLSCIRK